mmetsp:Transcript_34803/g.100007  ORF Transcript_34803/g.100007 Transcript_34803/m.100007 type:complete len:208 (-) Transcript_34803:363-986(-)
MHVEWPSCCARHFLLLLDIPKAPHQPAWHSTGEACSVAARQRMPRPYPPRVKRDASGIGREDGVRLIMYTNEVPNPRKLAMGTPYQVLVPDFKVAISIGRAPICSSSCLVRPPSGCIAHGAGAPRPCKHGTGHVAAIPDNVNHLQPWVELCQEGQDISVGRSLVDYDVLAILSGMVGKERADKARECEHARVAVADLFNELPCALHC